jgi:ferredoxin-type protein NapF
LTVTVDRRQFLRGRLRPGTLPLRPPWALAEADFTAACTRCDQCLLQCAEGILVRGSGGFPELDFSRGACSFCGACLANCEPGALAARQPSARNAWRQTAEIGPGCLSARGIVCRACGDACEPRAIGFRLVVGGKATPELQLARCTGCGACLSVCPVQAVSISKQEVAA